ncbi:Nn.00g021520.m01.CDS01 [Neocucurbitaria sp. VM-36]
MLPGLSRKRPKSDSSNSESPPKRARAHPPPTVFQTLDAPPKVKQTLSQTKAFLAQVDDESELSELSSSDDEFEDVPLHSTNKTGGQGRARHDEDSEESEDEAWEDALGAQNHAKPDHGPVPAISGDIALTLSAAPKTAFDSKPDGKKGPSKVQRQIRNVTHCMHVQYLMFHNLIRNAWIQDKEVQSILITGLSSGCWREIERYWRDAGISDGPDRVVETARKMHKAPIKETADKKGKWVASGASGVQVFDSPLHKRAGASHDKSKALKRTGKPLSKVDRHARDWGATSEPLEPNTPNLSAGDPLLRLLRYLSAYWKSKFRITTPSLRKRGYLSPSTLEAEIHAWRDNPLQSDVFGERVEDLEAFREVARKCEGSRDVGQQLFTALVRGLGIEARMIVSLQPVGFGWSRSEEGKPKNLEKFKEATEPAQHTPSVKLQPANVRPKPPTVIKRRRRSTASDASESSELSSVISISSGSEQERSVKKPPRSRIHSEELPHPTYWTEAISYLTHTPISVSPLPRTLVASASSPDKLIDFYARGAVADRTRQILAYVIAFSSDGTAKDVTTRYLPKHQWPGRTKGFRMPIERIPIHNKRGKVKRWEEWDWFKSLMRPYARPYSKRQPWDEIEDEGDLVPAQPERRKDMDEKGGKQTLQGYKTSAEYVLERHLRREEALKPGAKIVRNFVNGKGENEKLEPVYLRKDIVNCKTVESWHKEGREVKEGEQPLKYVPMRAVTVTRKREIEERERVEGGKVQQGLYSKAQTDWIIPDPIVNGRIPRNAFGNIDVYVPTMVPRGAVHIPLKGTARICRKLNVDYAEACTGFEFGKQRAVPVLTGVVVALENENLVIDAWEVEEVEKAKKEADKREKLVLSLWKKFLSGLRIVERMKAEYGDDVELPSREHTWAPEEKPQQKKSEWEVFQNHKDYEGGFLRDETRPSDGGDVREAPVRINHDEMGGGFFPASQEEPVHGDLTIDDGIQKEDTQTPVVDNVYRTPISLTSALQQPVSEPFESAADKEKEVTTDHDSDDIEEEEEDLRPSSTRRTSADPRSSRGRSNCSKSGKNTPPTRKRQSMLLDSSDEESSLDDIALNPPTPHSSTRAVPQRKAARKSNAQVKSHFFANESEGETDLTDMTDRNSPRKDGTRGEGKRKGRGGGSARGRGRGRGRGNRKKS